MKNKNNFEKELNILTKYHFKKSKEYQKILKGLGYKNTNGKIENLPFSILPHFILPFLHHPFT